jgi:hypothetical protein
MAAISGLGSLAALFVLGVNVFGAPGHGEAAKPPARESSAPQLLEMIVQGDSVDFVLIDPVGRVAVLAVDSAVCAIPDCSVDKYSDMAMLEHDDSDTTMFDTTVAEYPAYGGGVVIFDDPSPGTWRIEARAERECPDSCEVKVTILSIGEPPWGVMEDSRSSLHTGESVRWRLTMAARSERAGKPWARLRLDSGPRKRP